MVRKIGLIAFANDGGLGAQTRRLAAMLSPDRIMVVDSSHFSRNTAQHFEWYKDYKYFTCAGFPNNEDVKNFLPNLSHVFVCENPYNFGLIYWGQEQKTKIFVQSNYEFCDNLDKPWLPVPDKFLMPSYWKLVEMLKRFGTDRVMYLPPPIDPHEFEETRGVNLKREGKKRFLHIIGTTATADRNGTLDLLEAIKLTKSDFELVVKTQHPLPMHFFLDDPRVTYEIDNVAENQNLYHDFDAMLFPRRWGGLSLTTAEALMSGLPVLMSDISPNDILVPKKWRVVAEKKGQFMARTSIDFYSVDHKEYASRIDWLVGLNEKERKKIKVQAFVEGMKQFDMVALKKKYLNLLDNG